MKHGNGWLAFLCSTLALSVGCADDDLDLAPGGGMSGSSAHGGAAPEGGTGEGHGGERDGGGTSPEGGFGGHARPGAGGEAGEAVGGAGGGAAAPEHWLAFQLWTEGEDTHPLFVTGVPPQAPPVQVALDVDFWQWAPDGTKLIFATPAAYGGPPNAAYALEFSASGAVGEPIPLHEPLDEGAYAWSVSLSPRGDALALQRYEQERSTWYLRVGGGGVDDWQPIAPPVSGPQAPLVWSPDGARLAIVRREDASHDSLFIVDVASGETTQATFGTLRPFQWSADGSRFFAEVLSPDDGGRALYAFDADSASEALLLSNPVEHTAFDPTKLVVSTDGGTVAFAAQVGGVGSGRLFIKQVGDPAPATPVAGDNPTNLLWSEASQRFLFVSTHAYAVPRQGGDAARLNPEGTRAFCEAPPCLRPAGDAFVVMTSDADQDVVGNQLYDVDVSTAPFATRRLTAFEPGTRIDFLAVAPEPTRVLLLATDAAGSQRAYIVDRSLRHPAVKPLGQLGSGNYVPPMGWSPDSRLVHLAAASAADTYLELLGVSIVSGSAVSLTPRGRQVTSLGAAWRP